MSTVLAILFGLALAAIVVVAVKRHRERNGGSGGIFPWQNDNDDVER